MAESPDYEHREIPIDKIEVYEIDFAVYQWIKTRSPNINGRHVPVVFGAWERFAQLQGSKDDDNLNALRDHSGMLKLPIISIRRGEISPNNDRYVHITNEDEPSITIVKKIAQARFDDRRVPFTPKWRVSTGQYKKTSPVFEVQKIPYPKFVDIPYTITFWASYIKHANMFHKIIWDNPFPIVDFKGYSFFSRFTGSTDESNTEDFSADERIVRHSFALDVEGYLIDRDKVVIERSISKFTFEEKILDADESIIEADSFWV